MNLPQSLTGKVIHGEEVGRTIGFPTANIDLEISSESLSPGVYFGKCQVSEETFFCLPYFGPRLIFGETKNIFEVYIFDFHQTIYDQLITVQLLAFMRPPVKVDSLEILQKLLETDKKNGQLLLKRYITDK